MDEKNMVLDVLNNLKAGDASYAKIISECNNQKLRKTFQQMRDDDEKFQYDLYQIAHEKGYYKPAKKADQQECSEIKKCLCECES